jgi:hypothetical protein
MSRGGDDWIMPFALAIGAGFGAALLFSFLGSWLIR